MMRFYETQNRAIILLALVLAVGGLMSWQQMPKQEDPRLPDRFGSVTVLFPGADAGSIERLVLLPLEREIREVAEVVTISATARNSAGIVVVEIGETVYETTPVWDAVARAVERAEEEFPDGVSSVSLDRETTDLESITYAITGSDDWETLEEAAYRIERRLLQLDGVKRVLLTPDFDPQVTVELDQSTVGALSLRPALLASLIRSRSRIIPGGTTEVGSREVTVGSGSSFDSLDEIRALTIPAGENMLPLSAIAEVRYGPEEPVREIVRFNGRNALILGVVPEPRIDLPEFGERVRTAVADMDVTPLAVEELTFQPDRVAGRLRGLQVALIQGILIVAAIVIVAMGLRVGGVVALSVPAVAFSAILIYYAAGGILHQITVAALVVSLGLLVDNAIVVSERIQWRVDGGEEGVTAAWNSVRELFFPLAAATGTTLAAFVPLLLSKGVSADFTRAIPQVVMLTIAVSFLFAITVVPTLATLFFRRERHSLEPKRRMSSVAKQVIRRPGIVLASAVLLLLFALSLVPRVQLQFFPGADRNQIVLELELPTGTHVDETARAAGILEQELLKHPRVLHLATFAGRSVPAFYYNLTGQSNAPNFSQLLVTTREKEDVDVVADIAREIVRQELPGVTFVPRRLEQGPPASAPVALRLYSEDRQALAGGVRALFSRLREIEGTRDVRHDLDLGGLSYELKPVEAALLARGSSLPAAAEDVLGRTRGIPAGEYRGGREPAAVLVRSPEGERTPLSDLDKTLIGDQAALVPLAGAAVGTLEIRPATIRRENGRQVATVFSELEDGYGYNDVLEPLRAELPALLPEGVRYEIGGAAEGSQEANSAIAEASYLGVAMLLFILLLQFRSFLKVGLVLLTVPLAVVGVIPGLVLFREPFGFTSMLGAISLVGIVVNNAIILIDTIETKQKEHRPLEEIIPQAVTERMRPILLTVLTTVFGLTPLLFSESSLWPPFASAMISGLLASTVMTLLVIPATYFLIYQPRPAAASGGGGPRSSVLLLLLAAGALLAPRPALAQADELPAESSQSTAANSVPAGVRVEEARVEPECGEVTGYRRGRAPYLSHRNGFTI